VTWHGLSRPRQSPRLPPKYSRTKKSVRKVTALMALRTKEKYENKYIALCAYLYIYIYIYMFYYRPIS